MKVPRRGPIRGVSSAGLLALAAAALACAHPVERRDWSGYTGPGAAYFHELQLPPPSFRDPFEPWNRGVSALNHALIVGIVDPVGRVYRCVVPRFVRQHVRSFAANLITPRNLVANLLQGHWRGAWGEIERFAINTTVGGLGFFDPARSQWGIEPSPEDMGQTFAVWGWDPSTYFVLPLYGPSTLRDGVGLAPDAVLDPAGYFFPAGPILTFNDVSDSIDAYERFVESSDDPYDDSRILWTLSREEEIHDYAFGNRHEDTAQVQTLQAAFLAPRDPAFVGTLSTRSVRISTTGRELPHSLRLQPGNAPARPQPASTPASRRTAAAAQRAQ